MIWGYLSEFWSKVETVGEYTVEYFQGIGNSVAGAIGGFFDDLIHHIYDIFHLVYWFYDMFEDIFQELFAPIYWFSNLVKGLITGVETPVEELALFEPVSAGFHFAAETQDFFDAIPFFSLFTSGLGAIIGFYFVLVVLRKLSVA